MEEVCYKCCKFYEAAEMKLKILNPKSKEGQAIIDKVYEELKEHCLECPLPKVMI